MMTIVRSALFNLFFYLWSATIVILCLPLLLGPPRWIFGVQRFWGMGIAVALRTLAGIRHEVRGRENLPDGPVLIASKHQSAWETIILPLIVEDPAFVLKKELLNIPLFGFYGIRTHQIPIDRSAGSKALRKMLAAAKRAKADGRPIVIFPQGTRVAPGADADYLPGVAALYKSLAVPCVPVALNSGHFWGRNRFTKRPGRIVISFLEPIPAGLERAEFIALLRDRIESASRALAPLSVE